LKRYKCEYAESSVFLRFDKTTPSSVFLRFDNGIVSSAPPLFYFFEHVECSVAARAFCC
jgi:hypothetical protein